MFGLWNKLLTTDCLVIKVSNHFVYPIFRVGSTSLIADAEKKYVNHEIENCTHIDILLRDPRERFISGIHEYCRQNNRDVGQVWGLVQKGQLIDRHFAPQYMWLAHLYRYHEGPVTLRPFEYIKNITDKHKAKNRNKKKEIDVPQSFVDVDYCLMKFIGQRVQLKTLIEECKHVVS